MTETENVSADLPEAIGRYRVLCTLGEGGMARLVLARSEGIGGFERLVAIKMIHEHLSRRKEFVNMFLDEARIAARLHHPNVVPVYEVDVENGRHFLVMDYISGETLGWVIKHVWKDSPPFPLPIAAHIVAAAAEGLHAAHELQDRNGEPLGVVHRDVSLGNLMVGYDGVVRVMDFGIAKARDRLNQTKTGAVKGTFAYMAPEYVTTQSVDRRADVWALGVVLWETTVGRRLFKGKNDFATAAKVSRARVPLPSSVRKDYPEALERIVLKTLSKDRNERYESAAELAAALQEFVISSGHKIGPPQVKDFMADRFPERRADRLEIERRAEEENPTGLEGAVLPLSESLSAQELLGLDESEEEMTIPVAASTMGDVSALPRATPSMLGWSVVLILAATVGLGGLLYATRDAPPQTDVVQIQPPPQEAKMVTFTVETWPKAAKVTIDGDRYDGPHTLPQSKRTHQIEVALPGFEPEQRTVSAEVSRHLEVHLEALPEVRKRPPPPPRRRAKKKRRSKKKVVKSKKSNDDGLLVIDGEEL